MYWMGLVMRNRVTAMGSTSAATARGWPRRKRALSTMAGSEASEDCVLAATTCAGRMALAKAMGEVRANTATLSLIHI